MGDIVGDIVGHIIADNVVISVASCTEILLIIPGDIEELAATLSPRINVLIVSNNVTDSL